MTSSDLYDVTVIYDVTLLNEQFVNLGQGLSTKIMHRNTFLGADIQRNTQWCDILRIVW